ncbi:MAG TPA: MFS transporter [Longimicrobiales bacterium]|nr:MFS transporter [Longimicrobiales bacterium]
MSSATVPVEPEPLTRKQILVIFSGLLLAMLLAALDSTIVATALPTIVGELGGLERLAWVVTAYLLAQTVVTPLYGKLGDLYGRKVVLQTGIVIFLIGSVLCGMSTSMEQLILFRFIQGMGGGGLMVTTQAVVGDIVPPRDRGRYQGIFGAVFGVSSIAGPLLGGYFTTEWSWRWIFYINVPLGMLALTVIAVTLPRRTERVRHAIDYLGTGLLALALSSLVLFTDLGGVAFPWTSPPMIALGIAALFMLFAFVRVEARAAEPVLPLSLFANRTFVLTAVIGLIVGFALFGSVTYIPLFLQVVNGATPTASGLQMLPLMGGMLFTSILSGQLISRIGRYRIFPVIGTAVMALGLFLLSRMTAQTTVLQASLYMLVLGLGLGNVMQVLVIAVQNAVDYRELGVATSGATLFRLIGGSLGTAVFGAIFASRLAAHLAATLPAGVELPTAGISPQALAEMEPATHALYVEAFTSALSVVFLAATVIALIGFVLTWLVPELPLRHTIAAVAKDVGREAEELLPMPTDASSVARLERSLSLIASRDARREYIQRVTARAGIELEPLSAWLLVQIGDQPALHLDELGRRHDIPRERLDAAVEQLRAGNLITLDTGRDGTAYRLTDAGCAALAALSQARRDQLAETLEDWAPGKRDEMAAAVARLSRRLVPDAPSR